MWLCIHWAVLNTKQHPFLIHAYVLSRPILGGYGSCDRAVSWLTVESLCMSFVKKLGVPVLLITFFRFY